MNGQRNMKARNVTDSIWIDTVEEKILWKGNGVSVLIKLFAEAIDNRITRSSWGLATLGYFSKIRAIHFRINVWLDKIHRRGQTH